MGDAPAVLHAGGEEALRAEIVRLNKMVSALIDRAERTMGSQATDFGRFQTTLLLEEKVRSRTQELRAALAENEKIARQLHQANAALRSERAEHLVLIERLEQAQNQLLQSEMMASIGQLAAGVAHEINNPIGFVTSNLGTLRHYLDQLFGIIALCEGAGAGVRAGRTDVAAKEVDLDFLREDCAALVAESRDGLERVKKIVQNLKDFSHVDEAEWQMASLGQAIDSTLNVVRSELGDKCDVIREYGELPEIECLPFHLNQVFMNLLLNAAEAIAGHGTIIISTGTEEGGVWVEIADSGCGIPAENLQRIFDPFFTTKPVGKGTGLGLSLSYGIVRRHHGRIEVRSTPGNGATFRLHLPLRQRQE